MNPLVDPVIAERTREGLTSYARKQPELVRGLEEGYDMLTEACDIWLARVHAQLSEELASFSSARLSYVAPASEFFGTERLAPLAPAFQLLDAVKKSVDSWEVPDGIQVRVLRIQHVTRKRVNFTAVVVHIDTCGVTRGYPRVIVVPAEYLSLLERT